MSLLAPLPWLWSQATPVTPSWYLSTLSWFFVYGEPAVTVSGFWGGPLTWIKVVGLFCLLGWVFNWVITAYKERVGTKARWLDVAAAVALLGALTSALLQVLQQTKRIPTLLVSGQPAVGILAVICAAVIAVWVEKILWSSILRIGQTADLFVLAGMHLALGLGIGLSFLMMQLLGQFSSWEDAFVQGSRLGATYMGFVVLARVFALLVREAAAIRWRRIYAIAWHSVIESHRRMWAPGVVITVFLVILAFTGWFLQSQHRTAELGRLYVGTLALLSSLLLTVMVAILTPISLPNDIQQQTIYTIASKPVRRLELVWGRILGFMFVVTALLLLFGVISLVYLHRMVGGAIIDTEAQAVKADAQSRFDRARQLREEANQLRTRMSARVPVKGSLTFIDSRGKETIKGIDVGQELEYRSHIEGATQAKAIWQFGFVPDPIDRKIAEHNPNHRVQLLDRRVPVDRYRLLTPDSVEWLLDQVLELRYQEAAIVARQREGKLSASEGNRLGVELGQKRRQAQSLIAEYERLNKQADDFKARALAAKEAGRTSEYASLYSQSQALHSPPIALEMTFTVYRTTKGIIGEPVAASLKVINPRTGQDYQDIIQIHEYYTNRVGVPASILAGSRGDLRIEIQCISPTQYLGTSESDLFILARAGGFGFNFMKGLFGIWLQAMVLTAIGVWAGTFLSWPVALLTTLAFFVAGQVAFGFLQEFAMQGLLLQGGGPFESLIRLLAHDNLQSELTPTLAVVAAKTMDSIIMPVMSRLVYVVPNFSALDVSNMVADGFAVTNDVILAHGLLALAYALPFSVAGYFILKNREVAA